MANDRDESAAWTAGRGRTRNTLRPFNSWSVQERASTPIAGRGGGRKGPLLLGTTKGKRYPSIFASQLVKRSRSATSIRELVAAIKEAGRESLCTIGPADGRPSRGSTARAGPALSGGGTAPGDISMDVSSRTAAARSETRKRDSRLARLVHGPTTRSSRAPTAAYPRARTGPGGITLTGDPPPAGAAEPGIPGRSCVCSTPIPTRLARAGHPDSVPRCAPAGAPTFEEILQYRGARNTVAGP